MGGGIRKDKILFLSLFFLLFLTIAYAGLSTELNIGGMAKISDVTFVFDYTGSVQKFSVTKSGYYKIELWGASGCFNNPNIVYDSVGRGAYTSGIIELQQGETLYIYVGTSGQYGYFSFNGGGSGEAPGGGATDIRLIDGDWNQFNSLKSRIMVAGGGGGGIYSQNPDGFLKDTKGDAGGLEGYHSSYVFNSSELISHFGGYGATQTSGGKSGSTQYGHPLYQDQIDLSLMDGKFGSGGVGKVSDGRCISSGGGGGYYGGGHGIHSGNSWSGGGGGSSFISGYEGCDAISESSTEDHIIHTGHANHYSGKTFINGVMIDGNSLMPNPRGEGKITGNIGNGYAKITYINEKNTE